MDTYSTLNNYKKLEVTSTNRLNLVVMLYDAAIASLKQAQECHQRNDLIKRNSFVSRAQLIITEMNNSLNMEQGKEIAETLSKIYNFLNRHLNEVNTDNDIHKVGQALNILINLSDAWKEIAGKTEKKSVSTPTEDAAANSGRGNSFYG